MLREIQYTKKYAQEYPGDTLPMNCNQYQNLIWVYFWCINTQGDGRNVFYPQILISADFNRTVYLQ